MSNEFNIRTTNNKLFYITINKSYKQIEIPPGCYKYTQLNDEVKNQLIRNGDDCNWCTPISFTQNNATLKIDLKLQKGFQIDFTKEGTFRKLLGFDSRIVDGENNTSDFKPDIRSTIDNIKDELLPCICCNQNVDSM